MARILILANDDVGLYKFRKELIQELLNQGNHVFISLPDGEMVKPLIEMGCTFVDNNINRRGINPITDFQLFINYIRLVKSIKPDLVVTYTVKPNIYGGIVCRILKVPYAINITGLGTAFQNGGLLKKIIVLLYKVSCKKVKTVFFENEENKQTFINNKIVKWENTCKLNGAGVNLVEYQFCEYPLDNSIRFLFIGRVMKEKGIEELFDAASRIKGEYKNVIFEVVGPLEENYKEEIKRLESENIIKYHGFQTDVRPFILKSNCLVLPSHHEGMANTLLECGAMGRPLITSNIHGCLEAVIDGKTGFLVNVKSSEDLYQKIKKFINLPYNNKVLMGKLSRNHIENTFNKKKVVGDTIRELLK